MIEKYRQRVTDNLTTMMMKVIFTCKCISVPSVWQGTSRPNTDVTRG